MEAQSRGSVERKLLLIKQSYILITWAAYVRHGTFDLKDKTLRPAFSHLPMRRTRFTITKAPMAHKTFSQEQYEYRHHTLVIAFRSNKVIDCSDLPGVNGSILLNLRLRQATQLQGLGTNLFALSRVRLLSPARTKSFLYLP